MNAYADGLNYYLYKHPDVKPRVITRFEPWMALTFSEGSIGGDIETINLRQFEAFYGKASSSSAFDPLGLDTEPRGSNGVAIAPSNTTGGHSLLLDQPPHVVLLPRRGADGQRRGAECVRRADVGTVLHLSGLQRSRRLDAYVERCGQHRRVRRDDREEGRQAVLQVRHRRAAGAVRASSRFPTRPATERRRGSSPSTARTMGRSCARRMASGSASG